VPIRIVLAHFYDLNRCYLHMHLKSSLLLLFSILSSSVFIAQNDFSKLALDCNPDSYIAIDTDSLSRIIIKGNKGLYQYAGGECKLLHTQSNEDKNYVNELNIGPISDSTNSNNQQFMGSMTTGIWVKIDNKLKQWKPEGVILPSKIMALHAWNDFLFILTTNSQLYYWSHADYTLSDISLSDLPYIRDLCVDDWGNIYLLNENDIYKYSFINTDEVPYIWVNSIKSSFDEVEEPWANLIFEKDLVLSAMADISYHKPQALTYQYRIKDDQWSESMNTPNIHLTNLAPGNYSLQLRTSHDGDSFGYSEVIPFKVKGEFIDGFWKYLLFGFIGLAVLWLMSNVRNKREISELKSSSEKIRLENNLLKSKQKTLQLEMNPHFIFNSLNTIQGLIIQQDYKMARQLLNQFSQMMRSTLDQSREDSISLANEVKYLSNYLSLEKAARNNKFDFNIQVEKTENELLIPPMLIQPFVENAIIHGMKGIKKQGLINVTLTQNKNKITCIIDDNGVGRVQSKSKNKSHSTHIVNERIKAYSKYSQLQTVKIEDKIDHNNMPLGTTVIFEIPIINV